MTQLLEIHPFFDTAEPDVDEPAYLCILVLVFNAAQHCPTMEPLLDQHTKKHYHYLLDTYPLLMPSNSLSSETQNSTVKTNTNRFLKQTLQRVHDSEHLSMVNRIKLLERAIQDLKCLGSIEPGMRDATNFAHLYLQCQTLILKSLSTRFWTNPHALASQQTEIIETNIATVGNLTLQLKHKFSNLSPALKRRIQILKIHLHSLHLLFLVRASNKSALNAADLLLSEIELINLESSDEEIAASPFLSDLIKKLSEAVDHKPGTIVRIIQPLLLAHPLESLPSNDDSSSSITMCHAVIYDPLGMNETPLKYTAGMILAVPVDCEVFNVANPKMVRIAIKTPDQKIQLVTPKQSQFFEKEENCYRLLTEALMSHQVWSEALHVEIRLVLDLSSGELESGSSKRRMGASAKDGDKSLINICEPVKVYVLPKAVKRGI